MKGKMLLKGKHILSSLLIVTLVALNVSGGPQANVVRGASETYKPYTNLEEDYKFVWGDEFEGEVLDQTKWSANSSKMGGRNVLIVENTDKTIKVKDGALKLTAYKDDEGNYHVPNSVHTKETMTFKYGYVEIRAKLSLEVGSFASFWTRSVSDPGNTVVPGKLDHYAEVDMFETFQDKEGNQCTGGNILKNFPKESSKNWYATPMSWTQRAVVPDEDYHIFGYEWTPEEIKLYFDGNIYARLDISESWTGNSTEGKGLPGWNWNTTKFVDDSGTGMECFNEAQYLIFNHHLHHKDGFTASTSVTENENFKNADFVIDYCRVFQKEGQRVYAHTLGDDSYYEPEGIAVTYYDGIYSRGFTWSTDSTVNNSYLYIIKKTKGMTEDNVNWDKAIKQKASMVERTDFEDAKWHVFKTHIENLDPDSTYFYKVGTEINGWSEIGTIKTEKKESEIDGVTFFHLADCQCNSEGTYKKWAATLRAAYNKYPDAAFAAFSGDMANHCRDYLNMKQWIWALNTPKDVLQNMVISPTSGNHDIWENCFVDRFDYNYANYLSDTDDELKKGGCYYYTYGNNILFINLNTNEGPSTNEFKAQKEWLRNILEKYKDYKWKVVQLHKGPISTGDLSNMDEVKKYRNELCPMFSKYNVDLVLQGHYNIYSISASYSYWTDDENDESKYTYDAYDKAGVVTNDYEFDGEKRIWNLEPEGTHYITMNSLQNHSDDIQYGDEQVHLGINPILGEGGCSYQPGKPMYGVIRIKGGNLCYDAYSYDVDTMESVLCDTFSVYKEGLDKEESISNKDSNSSEDKNKNSANANTSKKLKVGSKIKDKASNGIYVVTANGAKKKVKYVSPLKDKVSKICIPSKIVVGNEKFKVTEIAKGAFKNNIKLKKIVIGKNIIKIGKNAFYGCRNLKTIKIKTVKLNKRTIGKNAFKKVNKKAKVFAPKKKLKLYKKILKKRGLNSLK